MTVSTTKANTSITEPLKIIVLGDSAFDGKQLDIEFWDTAGQEKFDNIHHSYFHQAHACIMIFDATQKVTYKNLDRWYNELRDIRPHIPCLCAVNKIDAAIEVTKKLFSFPKKHDMPLYFVSAADDTNVVRLFRDSIRLANAYRMGDTQDFIDQVLRELEVG
ncbi:unnamed protein product [Rotaria sp. Silwood2]|nr:unnamed protein product [Rotaria sp. Silwood2]